MTLWYGRELQQGAAARDIEYLIADRDLWCSSTVGGNTRSYHGLLIRGDTLLLAGLDESVNGVQISAQQYLESGPGAGPAHLVAFSVYPPSWTFMAGDVILRKTVTLAAGITVIYAVTGRADLTVRPLIAERPVGRVVRDTLPAYVADTGGIRWGGAVLEGDIPFMHDPVTYRNLLYARERERGYDAAEDLLSPGYFAGTVRDGQVSLRCFSGSHPAGRTAARVYPETPSGMLGYAAETFCRGSEILAGFPWFRESWGRDTAISVNGLLIDQDRKEAAQAVLGHLAGAVDGGLVPNRFPDNYRSSDAPLWFIRALGRYRQRWGDDAFMGRMRPIVAAILAEYPFSGVAELDGALIRVVPQSTWMDTPCTPRDGKPVEVNALWIHALDEGEAMGIDTPVSPDSAREAFLAFWNNEKQCLYDRIGPADPAVRPNQVMALALGLVEPGRAAAALDTVTRELLTPYGLRSLSPGDPAYRGRFTGDESYHNGCVWPWLTGQYMEALLRCGRDRAAIAPLLDPILSHIREAGAGYISEIFDGDPPFFPRGCIAQAWSVAEILHAYRLISPEGAAIPGTGRK